MEKLGKFSRSVELIILCVALCLTLDAKFTNAVDNSDGDVIIWSGNRYINSSGIILARVGSSLYLNCSVNNKSVSDVAWRNKGSWLNSITVLNTSVVQLKVNEVTWGLNASVYWCGPRNGSLVDSHLGAQVTIIVGDLPSPPRNPNYRIYGVESYEIRIYWKPAFTTGRLPTHYKVTYIPCSNNSYCANTPEYLFCRTPHITGKTEYNCKKLRQDMMLVLPVEHIYDLFHVTIATVNDLGESKAPSFKIDASYRGSDSPFFPTPLPPPMFNATVLGSNKIEVIWTTRPYWALYDLKYTILYHSVRDHKNETKVIYQRVNQKVNTITLTKQDGIQSYTKYYLYFIVEFINDSTSKSSGPSEPLGPIIVGTVEGRPDEGPNIIKTESYIYKHDSSKRNVTVVWEESSQSSWHGKPSKIKVQYRNINQESLLVKEVPVTQNISHHVMLTGLNSTDSYILHVSLCNTKYCGDMGLQKLIAPEKSTVISGPENKTGNKNTAGIVLGAVLSVLGLALIVLTALGCRVYYKRLQKRRKSSSLENRVGDLTIIYCGNDYEDVTNQNPDEQYRIPDC